MPKTGVSGSDNGVCPLSHLQFGENIGGIVSHGIWAEHEMLNDFGVRSSRATKPFRVTLIYFWPLGN